ncbi:ATP-binding protein [Thermofilum pendens]|uniref:ATP-binding protein n=1 Tax=Thermofilum pendens (strain DSM 2475 / Hrk 5) TaxID=368408 RepID=A1RYT1_THEPD|nr:AAA family ATPase [Thermofilum pendens]ABL78361.1 conserved hypothetical protein [Thermofilum pendens Hrk 5]
MNIEDVKTLLDSYNPWWRDKEWSQNHPLLRAVRESILQNPPRLFYHIVNSLPKQGYYGIVTIRGPRRVGKTTLIVRIIDHLISKSGIKPENVFYIPLDYKKLESLNLFDLFYVTAQLPEEKYIFLDEASMRRDWALVLKNLVDAGLVEKGKLKIIVTGSHSMDLAEAVSKLSDRQGRLASLFNLGGNLFHVPLRFVEILEAIRPDIDDYLRRYRLRKPRERFNILLQLWHGTIPKALEDFYNEFSELLNEIFEDYLLHGGFPKTVDQYHREGTIEPSFYHDLAELVISDSENAGLKPENTKRVLEFLTEHERLSSLLGLEKRENIGKHVTGVDEEGFPSARFGFGKYLEYLETTKLFLFPYREDSSQTCTPNYRADRKVYVMDPFPYYAFKAHIHNEVDPLGFSKKLLSEPGFKGRLVESVVAAHLVMAQQFFEHVSTVDYHKVLLYSKNEKETDYVLCLSRKGEKHRILIESKYRENARREVPEGKKIILTKNKLEVVEEEENMHIYVPVTAFLALF